MLSGLSATLEWKGEGADGHLTELLLTNIKYDTHFIKIVQFHQIINYRSKRSACAALQEDPGLKDTVHRWVNLLDCQVHL